MLKIKFHFKYSYNVRGCFSSLILDYMCFNIDLPGKKCPVHNSSMIPMRTPIDSKLNVRLASQERIHFFYYKPSQTPWLGKLQALDRDLLDVNFLSDHVVTCLPNAKSVLLPNLLRVTYLLQFVVINAESYHWLKY